MEIKKIPNTTPLKTDYIGSKRMLEQFLVDNLLLKFKFDTVIDAFSGSSFCAHMFKRHCKRVYANDVFEYPYTTAKALIENNSKFCESSLFGEGDFNSKLKKLYSVPLKSHWIESTYGRRFYTPEENDFYEWVRQNIDLYEGYERDILMAVLCRTVLRRIEHGKFSGTNNLGLRAKYDIKYPPVQEHFLKELKVFNEFIFDNGQQNKVFKRNVVEWTDAPEADCVYLDPPYSNTYADYDLAYFFLEALIRNWDNHTMEMKGKSLKTRTNKDIDFRAKKNALKSFEAMFKNFSHCPIVALSYNDEAYPDEPTIREMIKSYGWDYTASFSKEHKYRQQAQSPLGNTRKAKVVNEILVIGYKSKDLLL